jgi:hypothetical protein
MATEEVGVVELRVRGNEVCLSHPRRRRQCAEVASGRPAMCRGCLRGPSAQVCHGPLTMVITHEVVSTAVYTTYLEAQRVVEPTFTDTICIVIETRFCPILSARTKPPLQDNAISILKWWQRKLPIMLSCRSRNSTYLEVIVRG